MIIVQFHQKIRRIYPVYPGGTVFHLVIYTFTGYCVAQHNPANGLSAEQTNVVFFHRTDPVGNSVIINLKAELIKNICGIAESQMPVNIPVQILRLRILHSLLQLHQLCILGCHINGNIRRDPFFLIGQPFNGTGIDQRRYTHRPPFVIDLRI